MATEPGFTLYDRYGRLAAVFEIRAKRGATSEWAAELRRNLLSYEAFRYAPFFLLVTPGRVYLWKESPTAVEMESLPIPPDYEMDAQPLFQPYVKGTRQKLEEISLPAFELIVMSWLRDLSLQLPGTLSLEPLRGTGLVELARDGRITYPAAA